MKPTVTIGITAFNAKDSIGRAVSSALAQTWPPVEIIIVDDASTDATWSEISQLAQRHPQIRAFRLESNQGVGAARNRIVEEAQGDFIAFFDDDDESAPDRVAEQIQRIVRYEKEFAKGAPVICHTARRQLLMDGADRVEPTMGTRLEHQAPQGIAVARRILAGDPLEDGYGALATCSQLARTSVYRDLGGFDQAFRRVEDTEFCVRLALVGGHFVGLEQPLVTQTLTRTSDKSLEGELRYKLMLVDKHRAVFDTDAHFQYCRDWLVAKYHFLSGHWWRFAVGMARAAFGHPRLTWQRLRLALPALESNRAFSKFHRVSKGS